MILTGRTSSAVPAAYPTTTNQDKPNRKATTDHEKYNARNHPRGTPGISPGANARESVKSASNLIKQANWHGEDVVESLKDVETELDRVSAELAKYE